MEEFRDQRWTKMNKVRYLGEAKKILAALWISLSQHIAHDSFNYHNRI